MLEVVKGYKVFNKDWTCRDFQYEVGKSYEMPEKELEICKKGFHFCEKLSDCFSYYDVNPIKIRIAEVEAYGKILHCEDTDDSKCCTNKIRIIKEISWCDAMNIIKSEEDTENKLWENKINYGYGNRGRNNYGLENIGLSNYGKENSGNNNYGSYNGGHVNVGCLNQGYGNWGTNNFGIYNIGGVNLGDNNVGKENIGIGNKGELCFGLFCTKPTYVTLFNKPTTLTYKELIKKHNLGFGQLYFLIHHVNKIRRENLESLTPYRDDSYEINIDKLLNEVTNFNDNESISKKVFLLWKKYKKKEKEAIFELPNFDPEVFEELTTLDVTEEYNEYLKKKN